MKTALLTVMLAATWPFMANGEDQPPVPAGAGFRVEFDKAEYVLGENILAHAILTNEGAENFRASFGGDYRELGRADRYKVTVTNADGTILPDPLERKHRGIGGGFGSSPDLKAGEQWLSSLPLCMFVHFPGAGHFRVRITHDFGWSVGERKPPVAEAEIVVRMPDAEEAEALVEKAAAEKFNGGSAGKRSPEHASFAALYDAIFLPALRRVAERGEARAVRAIGDIESPEATGDLITLANSSAADVSQAAIDGLCARVRFVRANESDAWHREKDPSFAAAQIFGTRCWKPELAAPLAAQARRWFAHGTEMQRQHAIHFLGRVGEAQDVAPILECMQSALFRSSSPVENDLLVDPPALCWAGADALRRIGLTPAQRKTDAGLFCLVASPPNGKAELENIRAALSSRHPSLRQIALRSLPAPLPPEYREAVRAALGDRHIGVCAAAAEIAAKDKDPSYKPAVLALLTTERNVWTLRSATNAALALGARYEAARAWAAQLDDVQRWNTALTELARLVMDQSPSGVSTDAERTTIIALRRRWENFLVKNEPAIRKGRVFHPGEPALPKNLFAPLAEIRLKDGTRWPAPL